jgi:hypothetical protein
MRDLAESARLRITATGAFIAGKRSARLMLTQVALGCVALIGISYYSIPIALIIGGIAGILAVERQ